MNPIDDFLLDNVLPDKKPLTLAPQANLLASELALMDCGEISLLIPTNEIISLVSAQQLVAQPQSSFDCGYLEFEQQYYSIFCFNKSLQLQPSMNPESTTMVLFNAQNILFGVCCHELTKQNATGLTFHAVPPSMRSRKQPFTEFAILDNRAVGLSSVAALIALLRLRGAKLISQPGPASALLGAG
ncbi:MAG: chemotaxis protein CheW [Pseudomonadota bacterium]